MLPLASTVHTTRPTSHILRRLGEYDLLHKLGEGGFGEVYEAIDGQGRAVALKLPLVNDDRALQDFYREVNIVGALDHPNVVPILAAALIDGRPALVYPLGECSLADRVEAGIWPELALDYAEQLLDGLAHIHRRGYLHCDLKPDNVIVFDDDQVGITDFGVARSIDDAVDHTTSGTADYQAPEHRDGWVSKRSDVYEAAVVILELLTGWLVENPLDVNLHELLPRTRKFRAITPVLKRALAHNPLHRFASGAGFARAFRSALRSGRMH